MICAVWKGRSIGAHCVKRVQIRSYFCPVFSCIQSKYRKIRTRNKSVIGHFSLSVRPLLPVCTCLIGKLWELIFRWCSLKKVFWSLHENTCVRVSFQKRGLLLTFKHSDFWYFIFDKLRPALSLKIEVYELWYKQCGVSTFSQGKIHWKIHWEKINVDIINWEIYWKKYWEKININTVSWEKLFNRSDDHK